MRDWRSLLFWVALAFVAVEACFVVALFVRDGGSKRAVSGQGSIAQATATVLATAPPSVPSAMPTSQPTVATAAPTVSASASAEPASPSPPSPSASPSPVATRATAPGRPVTGRVVAVDSPAFRYAGRWEHISGQRDGRFRGKSSRTFVHGARATLTFEGRYVRLYGILGPGGGFATVRLDDTPQRVVDFFSAEKATHRLIYASKMLTPGIHHLVVAVVADPALKGARTQYVNIDSAEYGS